MCMSVAHYVHAQQSSPRVTSALQEHRSIHDAREGRGGEGRGGEGRGNPHLPQQQSPSKAKQYPQQEIFKGDNRH